MFAVFEGRFAVFLAVLSECASVLFALRSLLLWACALVWLVPTGFVCAIVPFVWVSVGALECVRA